MDYTQELLFGYLKAVGRAEVLNDLHIVAVTTTGVRTQATAVTCTSLGPSDRAILGDRLPGVASGFALCRHLRRLIPPELIP